MKKLVSIMLLACLCLSLTGYHLFFQLQIAKAKSEMFALLKNQKHHRDVVEFCLKNKDARELNWENDHEFSFNNEMYDLVEKKTDGDKIIIRCIADKHETELVSEYQKNNKQNHSNESVIQLITASFILPQTVSLNQFEKKVRIHYFNYSSPINSILSSILAPPPDVC